MEKAPRMPALTCAAAMYEPSFALDVWIQILLPATRRSQRQAVVTVLIRNIQLTDTDALDRPAASRHRANGSWAGGIGCGMLEELGTVRGCLWRRSYVRDAPK